MSEYHISYPQRDIRDLQLLLKLKNKDSIMYATLLWALDEFNKGIHEYIVSAEIAKKILDNIGIKRRESFSIEMFTDEFYYETYDGKTLLNIIKDKLPVIFFNF